MVFVPIVSPGIYIYRKSEMSYGPKIHWILFTSSFQKKSCSLNPVTPSHIHFQRLWVRRNRLHACLDYTLIDYSILDYRHLEYCGLQGHLNYSDIWTVAVWTNNFPTLYSSIWSILGLFEPLCVNLFIYLDLSRSFKASL